MIIMKILEPYVNLFISDYKRIIFLVYSAYKYCQASKRHVKVLPCLGLPSPNSFKIVETDASKIEYGGILKQKISDSTDSKEQLGRYHSGIWNTAQQNYSIIKKEILAIELCIHKFQDDLLNQEFIVCVDCKSAKDVLQKDVKNIASK
jgi:hypothetical protein